jgi:hypothetical protein
MIQDDSVRSKPSAAMKRKIAHISTLTALAAAPCRAIGTEPTFRAQVSLSSHPETEINFS